VLRGIQRIQDLGRIIKINEDRKVHNALCFCKTMNNVCCLLLYSMMSVWDGDECNRIRGTDSTIFPPFLKADEGLWTYTPDICMSTRAHFVRKSSYAGLPTSYYSINFDNFKVGGIRHVTFNLILIKTRQFARMMRANIAFATIHRMSARLQARLICCHASVLAFTVNELISLSFRFKSLPSLSFSFRLEGIACLLSIFIAINKFFLFEAPLSRC
jgi:hypothetical protein